MLMPTVVAARLALYACAAILLGSSLFLVYGLPAEGPGAAKGLRWPRPLLLGAAVVVLAATSVSIAAQTAVMADSAAAAFKPDALMSVTTDTQFGLGCTVRVGLALLTALSLMVAKPSRGMWLITAALGAGVAASFAWTGHGASDEGMAGWVHLVSDILHLLAAAIWLGALVALAILLFNSRVAELEAELRALHRALAGFSGIGSAVVAVLLATGLANSWFLVGPAHIGELLRDPYGLLLLAKVVLFAVMLGLAAINRYRLTPRLEGSLAAGAPTGAAVAALRRSVVFETAAGFAVLVVVSVLGTLAPLSSQ